MVRHKLIVISAPSGCGKTTIARAILQKHPEFMFSVSATTRPKRKDEVHGKDYFFFTREEFEKNVSAGLLVEWEEIYGNYYGTLKSEIDRTLAAGSTMLFDIDVKGALSIHRQYPADTLLVFIKPPSVEILTARLKNRKTEDEETIRKRLERVPMELEAGKEFDVSIVNDDLQRAIGEVDAVIRTHVGVSVPK